MRFSISIYMFFHFLMKWEISGALVMGREKPEGFWGGRGVMRCSAGFVSEVPNLGPERSGGEAYRVRGALGGGVDLLNPFLSSAS